MIRSLRGSLLLAVWLLGPIGADAQTHAAPVYSLPDPGTWVEYAWKAARPGGEQTGTLRISFVGRQQVTNRPYCWIEIKKEVRDAKRPQRQLRKLLVAEQAFNDGQSFQDHVAAAYEQNGPAEGVTRLSNQQMEGFLGLYLSGEGAMLKTVRDQEKVKAPLGEFVTRHVVEVGRTGGRLLQYDGWLTSEVPFGWVRFEIREQGSPGGVRPLFAAAAVRHGRDARSEVDESKSR